MANEISNSDVFRFVQLRPAGTLDRDSTVPLVGDTPLAQQLLAATDFGQRTAIANSALKAGTSTMPAIADLPLGPEITAALAVLKQKAGATTDDLRAQLPSLASLPSQSGFAERRRALSNALLASFHATEGIAPQLGALQDVYRVYALVAENPSAASSEPLLLSEYFRRTLLTPAAPAVNPEPPSAGTTPPNAKPPAGKTKAAALQAALHELTLLDRPEHLVQPGKLGMVVRSAGVPFSIKAESRKKISKATSTLLTEHNINLAEMSVDSAVHLLSLDLQSAAKQVVEWLRPGVETRPGVTLPPAPARALIRPAGVADLLVVKQQIKRFEPGEIAHVESVLSGEKKSRAHRQLERVEETTITETETTNERATELQTADRFELNREASNTLQEDQQLGAGLTLSGKYGPTVEFSSNFSMNRETSREESARSSSRYAHDVVSRSLERIAERVREQRSRTRIREIEETNLHELNNTTSAHQRGVYQFLDKIYEAQVFNYGKREMFDFMVPEPASFLWHVEQHPSLNLDLPPAPEKLDLVIKDASDINEANAMELAARFGATDIDPPPPYYKMLSTGIEHGADTTGDGESGYPRSVKRVELTVPEGYRPVRAYAQGIALSDAMPVFSLVIGSVGAMWKPVSEDVTAVGESDRIADKPQLCLDLWKDSHELSDSKLSVSVLAYESNSYSIHVTVVLLRTECEMDRWRLSTYKKVKAAYDERLREYQNKVDELTTAAKAAAESSQNRLFGAPPAENTRTIQTELKKHCISIITQQRYDAFDATKDGAPPTFSFAEAAAEGAYIRFFEQAFEWDQMQYVFYPYFWARKNTWIDRFVRKDSDPQFLEFLKAGAARVVVPVRPGFEIAVTHFIETGKIWSGEGEPPQISSPLYVSIVDEIRERTGAPKGEEPVSEPWDVRVPTALVVVRDGAELPAWQRTAPGSWTWVPVETP